MPNRTFLCAVILMSMSSIQTEPLGAKDAAGSIVFESIRDGDSEVFLMDANGGNQVQLTRNEDNDSNSRWSPDANQIVFVSDRDGNANLYFMNSDGTGQTRLTDHPMAEYSPTWSPDGTMVAYNTNRLKSSDPRFCARMSTALGGSI